MTPPASPAEQADAPLPAQRAYAVALGPGPDPRRLLHRLRDEPGLACLRGDWFGGETLITHSPVRPAAAMADLPSRWLTASGPPSPDGPVRVGGGWIGVVGYQPEASAGAVHDWVLRLDPSVGWVFESLDLPEARTSTAAALARLRSLVADGLPPPPGPVGDGPRFRFPRDAHATHLGHLGAVERAQQQIRAGDFYQVNLCTRLIAESPLSPTDAFVRCLATLHPVRGALLNHPDGGLVSLSPELFLSVTDDRVVTRPIKGTAPRTPEETDAPELRRSVKESAENVMIVDLMRNDLSRVSRPGTVAVTGLLELEPHAGVWHLVSTVAGTLRPGLRLDDVLAETFPPGSVTGAPKSSAVRAIAELESSGRGAYTGAVGMVSPYAGAEFNVAIRTFEFLGGPERPRIELGVGGGITSDSVPELEWAECLHKARPLVTALGGALPGEAEVSAPTPTPEQLAGGVFESCLVAEGRVRRLRRHLARLDRSCRELYGVGLPPDLTERARRTARTAFAESAAPRSSLKIIVTPTADGVAVELITRVLGERLRGSALRVAERPAGLWRHKWVDRTALSRAEETVSPDLPLFLDERGTVLEGSRGNVFLLTGAEVRTPPLREELLPGVTREALVEALPELGFTVRLDTFTVEDLGRADAAWWTSSLSGVVAVTAVDERPVPQRPKVMAHLQQALEVISAG